MPQRHEAALRDVLEERLGEQAGNGLRSQLGEEGLQQLCSFLADKGLLTELLNCVDTQTNWLMNYRRDEYSQRGEDGVLDKIFAMLPTLNRWCIEFGASNGRVNSNTLHLIEQGWSSVQIEGKPGLFQQLKALHEGRGNVFCLNAMVGIEGETHLEKLVEPFGLPDDVDLVSIDIDGCDYHIWKSLDRLRPKVILIEFNPTIAPHISYVPPCDFARSEGCSLRALWELGQSLGYRLVCNTRANAIFVRTDLAEVFGVDDSDPAVFFRTPELTASIFQLFDGTLVVEGNRLLNWTKAPFGPRDLQVLPWFIRGEYASRWPKLRRFWLNRFYPKRLDRRRPATRDYPQR